MSSRASLIGTAGWSLPLDEQAHFPGEGSRLERYARVFPAVEINSTFQGPHRASTFERWASSVPPGFRFSVKMPRTITHDAKLGDTQPLVEEFLGQLVPLASHLGCLLAQLPPRLAFDDALARRFLGHLRERHGGGLALEPRHASWFTDEAERLLDDHHAARVAADPPRAPGGWDGMAYYRLHGSPRIFDNTTLGAGTGHGLGLMERLGMRAAA